MKLLFVITISVWSLVNSDIISTNSNDGSGNSKSVAINNNQEILNVGNQANANQANVNGLVAINGQFQQQQQQQQQVVGLGGLLDQIGTLLNSILNQLLQINVISNALNQNQLLLPLLTEVRAILQNLLNSLLNSNQNPLILQVNNLIAQVGNLLNLINQKSLFGGLLGQLLSPVGNIFVGGALQIGLVPSLLLQVMNILSNLL
ncbi:GSCOCG00001947001-RA-CDS [Cotesia congregata]|uniref:Uncharacterized protein n=1 Tax=Cotesia congregata TaxID=51543 RepID=A0A8J2HTY3_COTCN|nr:GSCOCG00001947001-RA-CDS [Cotesia congregata]CAG5108863.1 Protein of unknown function [Cotesia congregata]